MKVIKIIGFSVLAVLLFLGLFITYSTITYYDPAPEPPEKFP